MDDDAQDRLPHEEERARRETEVCARARREAERLQKLGVITAEPRPWRHSAYGSLDHDFGLDLPQLVVGLPVDGKDTFDGIAAFTGGRPWHAISHQSGGHACRHPRIVGTVLRVRADVSDGLHRLANRWCGSEVGGFGRVTLDELEDYRSDLRARAGVDCNRSWRWFQEACYPIDVDDLTKVSDEPLPADLDELIVAREDTRRWFGPRLRWALWWLGENGD